MDSDEAPPGLSDISRAIAALDATVRSKISPHLRAAVRDWENERVEAWRGGVVLELLPPVPVHRALIELTGSDTGELEGSGVIFRHLFGLFYAAEVPLDRLIDLATLASVKHIHREREAAPTLDDSIPEIRANSVRSPQHPFSAGANRFTGAGVIVGIIDSGINYLHPAFRLPDDQTKSRIVAILDQTVTPPVTITKAQIEAAIATNTQLIQPGKMVGGVRVESDTDDHKHGTHVAGIAAGNGSIAGNCKDPYTYVGVAPESLIVAVKYNFGAAVQDLRDAIDFIATTASTTGADGQPGTGVPCVINMSLGHNIGPHDGTDPMDVMIDDFVRDWAAGGGKPVVLVAAAGNAGGHQQPGRIAGGEDSHVTGTIAPSPVVKRIAFKLPELYGEPPTVPSKTIVQFRYTAPVGLGCRLIPPGNNVSGPNVVAPDADIAFVERNQGSNCNINSTIDNAAAGRRRIDLEITSVARKWNQFGEWVVELTSGNAGPISYHGWISGPQFERFKDADLSRANTVKSPGSATSIICVGNYHSSGKDNGKIADSSSRGPRLDGLQKPDLSAPGVDICSPKRDFHQGCCCDCCCDSYIDATGTSMSAPHVTGAVALLLQRNPALTHAEIKAVLMANARRDSFTAPALPDNDFGNGKLDVLACLNAAAVRGAGAVIASATVPSRSRSTPDRHAVAASIPRQLPQLEEDTPLWRLLNTAEGQRLYLLGRAHWDEVRALVNSNKRIATVWHRNYGPLLLHHVTRTTMLPHVALPREIDGEEVAIRAARLVSALEQHASKELIRALHETLPIVAQLQGRTLLEVVEMFEANEAKANEAKDTGAVLEHV